MTQEQIEAKALEEFPVEKQWVEYTPGFPEEEDRNEHKRAAFITGCQYAATPSAVSGLQWVKANERFPEISTKELHLKYKGRSYIGKFQYRYYFNFPFYAVGIDDNGQPSPSDLEDVEWLDESSPAQPGFSEADWVHVGKRLPEEIECCFWCRVPVVEPPHVGSLVDDDFPDPTLEHFTHWKKIENDFFPLNLKP